MPMFMPPKRRCWRKRFAYRCEEQALRRYTSKIPKRYGESVLHSSTKIQRRHCTFANSSSTSPAHALLLIFSIASLLFTGIVAQECTVKPPMSAAIVFCVAR